MAEDRDGSRKSPLSKRAISQQQIHKKTNGPSQIKRCGQNPNSVETIALSGTIGGTPSQRLALSARHDLSTPLKDRFPLHLPKRPNCTNDYSRYVFQCRKKEALEKRYIQFNNSDAYFWLVFDIDYPGAYFAEYDANVPRCNVIMINPANGHGHLAYLLKYPVRRRHDQPSQSEIFYKAVKRGYTARLHADPNFAGALLKNPYHSAWETEWRRDEPYTLNELNDWLFRKDKQSQMVSGLTSGIGRNNTLFNELREFAYKEVRHTSDPDDFYNILKCKADKINDGFVPSLDNSEVKSVVKSVFEWTFMHFSKYQFSKIQSNRGKKGVKRRWAGHTAESKTEPWKARRISRATYYRKKKNESLP